MDWGISMERRRIEGSGFTPVPKLDFSNIKLEGTPEEYAQIRREIAACSSKEFELKRLAYIWEHPERLISWDHPFTPEEYERRLLKGEI